MQVYQKAIATMDDKILINGQLVIFPFVIALR